MPTHSFLGFRELIADLEKQTVDNQETIDDLNTKLGAADDDLREAEAQVTRLEGEIDIGAGHYDDLKEKYDAIERLINELYSII
jgi:predicted  nucleic acid-binding Zn-ribbon protein